MGANKFQIIKHYLVINGVECILGINQENSTRINI